MEYTFESRNISPSNPAKVALTLKSGDHVFFADQIDLSQEAKRNEYIDKAIAANAGLKSEREKLNDELLALADKLLNSRPKKDDGTREAEVRPVELSKSALAKMAPEIVEQAKTLLGEPKLIDCILEHISRLGVVGEKSLALAVYLIATSRLLAKPLAGIVLGASSSGKSFIPDSIGELFPDETKLLAHRITPQALYHMPKGSLMHRVVIAGERSRLQDDNAAEATRALREMISDGVLRLSIPQKDRDNKIRTVNIEQPGPIAYLESSTLAVNKIFDEDRTRFVILGTDETAGQTLSIMRRMANDSFQPPDRDQIEMIVALHHAMQRLLEPKRVSIPYAGSLVSAFPSKRVEARRAFKSLLCLISTVALLHQKQRAVDDAGWIVATQADYETVRNYLTAAVGVGLGRTLTPGAQRVLETIEDEYTLADDDKFTVRELAEHMQVSHKTLYPKTSEIHECGFIILAEKGTGPTPSKYRRVAHPKGKIGFELPSFEKLGHCTGQEPETLNCTENVTYCIE